MQYGPAGFFPRAADLPGGPAVGRCGARHLCLPDAAKGPSGSRSRCSWRRSARPATRARGRSRRSPTATRSASATARGSSSTARCSRATSSRTSASSTRACAGAGRAVPARARRASRRSRRGGARRCSASCRRRSCRAGASVPGAVGVLSGSGPMPASRERARRRPAGTSSRSRVGAERAAWRTPNVSAARGRRCPARGKRKG